ncbi:hypothetical protein E8E13_005553 [Curvularia kusanoi]|uniref:PSP1 C-terminal domain-containing protein n=1 Tax=Curvularia kusanoi TaxID=90978 RepID=A0A9P4TL64_CURKU|nr:hypothetical protein E8E13_005553 [Curvularia kusanoi]
MSSSTYKGNLSVGGSALDKSKLQLRRPTPDSDVLASSDDDREHVPTVPRPAGGHPGGRRPSSGWLQDIQPNRKFSLPSVSFAGSQPTTPSIELPNLSRSSTAAFPWNTSSFSSNQANSRLKEVVPSPTSAHFPSEKPLPSPAAAEDGIGFLLSQSNPIRKAVRSQSYSIGQGDMDSSPVFSSRVRSTVRNRPSKPSLLGDSGVGLSQLREDDIDEIDPLTSTEHGVRLPQGYWEREQKQALLKQAAVESARARNRATSTSSPVYQHPPPPQRRQTTAGLRGMSYADTAIEDTEVISETALSSLETLGRRHSFAHISPFAGQASTVIRTLENTEEEDESLMSPRQAVDSSKVPYNPSRYFSGAGPVMRAVNEASVCRDYPDPVIVRPTANTANPYEVPKNIGGAGRRLFVVTFKCARADIYYVYDNTGLEIQVGNLVIVEGDRGYDLGQVAYADVSLEDAKMYKAKSNEEHFRWLVMFSRMSLEGRQNESGMLGALARAKGFSDHPNDSQMAGMVGNQDHDSKPKMIRRLALDHEIEALRDKEGAEAKAKRLGAQKAAEHGFPMEILDAEYQADYHKLTYFYYADYYVNFNELVSDLFKQYKVRIWMSAVNPASVMNQAGMTRFQPPSAIGPGAIVQSNNANPSLAVGPGFGGNNNRRANAGRPRDTTPRANYDDGTNLFSHQLPTYNAAQGTYGMPHWAQNQQYPQQGYGNFHQPPSTSGTPTNFGAYYPPGSAYGFPTAYNRGYPVANSYTPTGTSVYSQQATPGAANGKSGNGGSTSQNSAAKHGNDQTLLAGMQNMTFAGK